VRAHTPRLKAIPSQWQLDQHQPKLFPALLPRFRPAQTGLHQGRAQIVKQLRIDFVVVFRWNSGEGGKSLTESRRERR